MVQIREVTKSFGSERALDGVSFDIAAGEVVGLVGPNGAGKSTLMRIVCRLVRPESGTVALDGFGLDSAPADYQARLGALIDTPGLYPYMTGRQHVRFVRRIRGTDEADTVAELLVTVGLPPDSRKIAKHFSLGMRQRLGIAMALVHSPRLLVLDEPMNGLDPGGMKDLRELIVTLASRDGVAVLLSSHLLSEIELVCQRVVILNAGRVASNTVLDRVSVSDTAHVFINTTANDVSLGLLSASGYATTVRDGGLSCLVPRGALTDLAPLLVAAGVGLTELREIRPSLENQYLSTVRENSGRLEAR